MATVLSSRKDARRKAGVREDSTVALEKEIARCNNIQMAKKISLNSAYGAIGNQYFRYYKLANAELLLCWSGLDSLDREQDERISK